MPKKRKTRKSSSKPKREDWFIELSDKTKHFGAVIIILVVLLALYFTGVFDHMERRAEGVNEIDEFARNTVPHWTHMPITYSIDDACNKFQSRRIVEAFDAIKDESGSVVRFQENNRDPDIFVRCFFDMYESTVYNLTGEASANLEENKLTKGLVYFYNVDPHGSRYSGGCQFYPDREIHHILHLFGFDHVDSSVKRSIMNPPLQLVGCQVQEIDQDIISELEGIYYKE